MTLRLRPAAAAISLAAMYEVAKAKDFWEDNVGITPMVLRRSPMTRL